MTMKRIQTVYPILSSRIERPLRLAVAADLHSSGFDDVLDDFFGCDAVLLPGDLVDRHRRDNHLAEQFLQEVPARIPVFLSVGNHERKFPDQDALRKMISGSSVILLDNRSVLFQGIRLGGLSSVPSNQPPDLHFLESFEKEKEFRILLCHHPETYRDYVAERNIDLTLCGHAHGGQIQIGNQGLFAPGQGFFPKLTHGVHDGGRMIISRGMTNGAKPRIPRIHNPCELIILELKQSREEYQDE